LLCYVKLCGIFTLASLTGVGVNRTNVVGLIVNSPDIMRGVGCRHQKISPNYNNWVLNQPVSTGTDMTLQLFPSLVEGERLCNTE
jgi:hypothetical protein